MNGFRLIAITIGIFISGLAMADNQIVDVGRTFKADQLLPVGVRAEVGTTGFGGAFLWRTNPYVGLALGYSGGDISWSDDLSVDHVKYDMDMDHHLTYLNAEVRPWGTSQSPWVQGIYVAAGVAYVDSEYRLNAKTRSGKIEIDGKETGFSAVSGHVNYDNEIAPYLGFGFAPKINENWGVFGEVGAYYTGNPKVHLNGVGGSVEDNELLAEHERSISNDEQYKWMPVAKLGVSYYW